MLFTTQGISALLPVCAVMEVEFSVAKWTGCGPKVAIMSFHSGRDSVPTAAIASWDRDRRSRLSLPLLLLLLFLVSATERTVHRMSQTGQLAGERNTYLCNFTINNSVALSPQANYTDWSTATCRRNLVPTFVDRGGSRGQRGGSRYISFTYLLIYSHKGWVKHIPAHYYTENLVAPVIAPGTSEIAATNSDY
jgi:hypothetical protein